jgi:hypothetical protein
MSVSAAVLGLVMPPNRVETMPPAAAAMSTTMRINPAAVVVAIFVTVVRAGHSGIAGG